MYICTISVEIYILMLLAEHCFVRVDHLITVENEFDCNGKCSFDSKCLFNLVNIAEDSCKLH